MKIVIKSIWIYTLAAFLFSCVGIHAVEHHCSHQNESQISSYLFKTSAEKSCCCQTKKLQKTCCSSSDEMDDLSCCSTEVHYYKMDIDIEQMNIQSNIEYTLFFSPLEPFHVLSNSNCLHSPSLKGGLFANTPIPHLRTFQSFLSCFII